MSRLCAKMFPWMRERRIMDECVDKSCCCCWWWYDGLNSSMKDVAISIVLASRRGSHNPSLTQLTV